MVGVIVACDGIFEMDKLAVTMMERVNNAVDTDGVFNPKV